MPFDLQHIRQDIPGRAHALHFNNAGSSLVPRPVLDATIAHLQLEARIGTCKGMRSLLEGSTTIVHVWH